jgi:hypothetical protein
MSTIERLSDEYRQADLHPKKLDLVKDEEVSIFLDYENKFWTWVFWIVFAGAILFVGVIGR